MSKSSPVSNPSDEITTPAAAALLGMTIPETQKLFRSGAIPAWKSSRGWTTTRQAVIAYGQRVRVCPEIEHE
ncbi:MAG: helix-turn-helix domain-containing protein [Chloroflexi bacterium]|nr:helix-turn-helix domain-containing protein [Chloroflexota bacterium]MBU1751710.1 helix-turn-helix domain-containing protein [Chloroflexota bacterium]